MLLTETKFSSLKFSSEFIIFQAYYILYLFIQALLVISFFLKCAMTDWAAAVSLMPRRISSCKTEAGLPHWSVNITNFQFFYGPSVPAERMVLAFVHWFSLANEQFLLSLLNFSLLTSVIYSVYENHLEFSSCPPERAQILPFLLPLSLSCSSFSGRSWGSHYSTVALFNTPTIC